MKKFLFPTDFSANAGHALDYGYNLAKQVKANMVICNAIIEVAEVPQSGMVAWPMEDAELLEKDSYHELALLKKRFEGKNGGTIFAPAITCSNESGTVMNLVNSLADREHIDMIIAGTHGAGGLTTLLLGNHSRQMIDEVDKPLLLIPPSAEIRAVKKIAFATDFTDPVKDLEHLLTLITLAKPLNAEILLTHIYNERSHAPAFQRTIGRFMIEVADNANYPNIYYREVKSRLPVAGLDWLCEHGDIDILAMVHRSHNFIDSLFRRSQTQKMAAHLPIPLLVFPANGR